MPENWLMSASVRCPAGGRSIPRWSTGKPQVVTVERQRAPAKKNNECVSQKMHTFAVYIDRLCIVTFLGVGRFDFEPLF